MKGEWEPDVMHELISRLNNKSVFWEVGGGWGYFSNALAPFVHEVYAFEAIEQRAKQIRKSAERNENSNLYVICDRVDENIDLNDLKYPDVALVDIEGYEYEFLNQNKELLSNDITFIIELHDQNFTIHERWSPDFNKSGVKRILKQHSYNITSLSHDHIIAVPSSLE